MDKRIITRRDFLRVAAGVAAAATLGTGVAEEGRGEETARVVLVRDAAVLDKDGVIRPDALKRMVDEGVKTFLGETEPLAAWRKLFKSSDVVGVKSNSWPKLPTPKELEAVIKGRLMDAGVPEKNIEIADRSVYKNPTFQKATALVNVRPARTHHWSGMGSCLKNYIQFVPEPSTYHPQACSDLGAIWHLPIVKGRTRLNILVLLTPQFYGRGASFFDRRYVWPYKGLLIGADPVAVDAVGAHLLQTKRIAFFGEDRPLDVPPIHITVADKKYHLGISDLSRIQIVKLGWMEDILI